MKFGEWSDYCLPLVKSRMKANTYHNNYEIPLYLHLQPYFGEWEPREIKTSMVQQFVDIKGERYAKETIKKMTGCMSLLMDFAIDEGLADRNPVTRRIYIQSAVPPQVKRVWTQEQYDKAWAFARYRLDAAHILIFPPESDAIQSTILKRTASTESIDAPMATTAINTATTLRTQCP